MDNKPVMSEDDLEAACMEVISNAGAARALVYEALDEVMADKLADAKAKIESAEDFLHAAHEVQFKKIMRFQMDGGILPFQLIILHAMDLLMVATAERDLVKHIIDGKYKE